MIDYNNNLTKYLFNVCRIQKIKASSHITIHTRLSSTITSSIDLQKRVKHNDYEDIEDNLHSLLLSPPSIIRFGQGFNNQAFLKYFKFIGFHQSLLLLLPNNCRVLKIVRQRGPPQLPRSARTVRVLPGEDTHLERHGASPLPLPSVVFLKPVLDGGDGGLRCPKIVY